MESLTPPPNDALDEQALLALDEQVPQHLRSGIKLYVTGGYLPGAFLQAVICHELEAVALADPTSLVWLPDIHRWFHNEAPVPCHGSRAKMEAWSKGGWKQLRKEVAHG